MVRFFKQNRFWISALSYLSGVGWLCVPTSLSAQDLGKIENLDLPPEVIESSPVLQRWQSEIPNLLEEIRHEPSFPTRIRAGYSLFPSSGDRNGWTVGVEDVFIDRTGLTLSADYSATFDQEREATGFEARYYTLPLGNYVNIAPSVGYRYIRSGNYETDGVKVGARANFALSPQGGADFSISQNFMSPGSEDEVGITNFSIGYAVTPHLRLATEIEKQNSRVAKDSRVSVLFEWMN